MNLAHLPPLVGRSPVARSTPWLSNCALTWSLRNPGSEISTTSCSSPASFHSTPGSKSSNTHAVAALFGGSSAPGGGSGAVRGGGTETGVCHNGGVFGPGAAAGVRVPYRDVAGFGSSVPAPVSSSAAGFAITGRRCGVGSE